MEQQIRKFETSKIGHIVSYIYIYIYICCKQFLFPFLRQGCTFQINFHFARLQYFNSTVSPCNYGFNCPAGFRSKNPQNLKRKLKNLYMYLIK